MGLVSISVVAYTGKAGQIVIDMYEVRFPSNMILIYW